MKPLAAVFAAITFLAVLLGFMIDVIPILALCGKIAAGVALVGFAITSIVAMEEATKEEPAPSFEFDADAAHA
ncbi:MAG: hypothetical protein IPP88_09105 [Betaproteobacteria bacterium]|nr:hypothetical protein [Betaproteobacteria bacterium]